MMFRIHRISIVHEAVKEKEENVFYNIEYYLKVYVLAYF